MVHPTQVSALAIITVLILGYGSTSIDALYQASLPARTAVALAELPDHPVRTGEESLPTLTAHAVYALDLDTDAELFSVDSQIIFAPASTTKLMTALIARQRFSLDEVITVPVLSDSITSHVLRAGEIYSVRQLLAATLITSDNLAAYSLATHHPEGLDGFLRDMNTQASELSMNTTYFTNPAGFDSPGHKTTARDLSVLFRMVLRDTVISEFMMSPRWELQQADGSVKSTIYTTHQLLGVDPRVISGKTGTTDEAGQVLLTQLTAGKHPYLLVMLGSENRYTETSILADWVERNITWQPVDVVAPDRKAS